MTPIEGDSQTVEIAAELLRFRHTLTVWNHNKKYERFKPFENRRIFLITITNNYIAVFGGSMLKIAVKQDTKHATSPTPLVSTRQVPTTEKHLKAFEGSKLQTVTQNRKTIDGNKNVSPTKESCEELTLKAFKLKYLFSNERTQNEIQMPPICPHHTSNDVLPAYSTHSSKEALPAYSPPRDRQ